MTYRQGETILASDINTFVSDLLDIYDVGNGDSGYGQIDFAGAATPPSVIVGELIKSAEWTAFRNAAQDCSDHQGSTTFLPPTAELAVGEIVEAHEFDDGNAYDINGSLATLLANRLIADAGSVTVFSNVLNSTRNTAWSNALQHRFTATFGTVDQARYFFNSGGQIRFRGSRSGGSATPQNADWTNLLVGMGSVIMDYTQTTGTGTGTSIGYYDLTTGFQLLHNTNNPGAYAGNDVFIYGRTVDGQGGVNGDNGRILEFRVDYIDGHVNPFFDQVDGTITSDIDYRRATSPLTTPTPVFATSVGLSAGS